MFFGIHAPPPSVHSARLTHCHTTNKTDRSPFSLLSVRKRLRDSILSPFFHSYIFAIYKNEALLDLAENRFGKPGNISLKY